MRSLIVKTGVTCLLALPVTAQAQTRGFVVMLGSDTIGVERFERSGDRVVGMLVRRLPQTNVLRYAVSFNADGSVASYQQSLTRADGSPIPNAPAVPLKMTFTADSVFRDVIRNNEPVNLRSAAPKTTLPNIGGSWLGQELAIQTAKRGGQVFGIGVNPQQAAPTQVGVQLIGSDSAEIVIQGFRTGFKLDGNGQIVRGDGSLTTQKFIVTPDARVNAASIANEWAAKDAAGQPMGIASPRDTVTAVVGGANVWIDYGRPSKRGRTIWGTLVPYDTTWRLGANAATQLKTDKDLDIGGMTVPAGMYTLWLLPSATKSFLVVNTQTGQWGTAYDSSKDLVRIPLDPHMSLPESEERFRIFVVNDMLMMHWDRGGYGVKIKSK